MRTPGLSLAFLIITLPVGAWDLGVVQESSASFQIQTVQAEGYWGSYQGSGGLAWTIGLDCDRVVTLRAGLTAHSVSTSPVIANTVYPGYQGWGPTLALDWTPVRGTASDTTWGLGGTVAGSWETMTLPGLYRTFSLPTFTVAALGELVLPGTQGLAFRMRVPLSVDQRPQFSLAWRAGVEAAVVFRGVGWTIP